MSAAGSVAQPILVAEAAGSPGCALGSHAVEQYPLTPIEKGAYRSATITFPTDVTDRLLRSVVIVPGYMCAESTISAWAPFYASHGIVAMTIGMTSPLSQPKRRCAALLAAIELLKAEHTRTGSPLEGRLDVTRVAVQGWSLGGGGAQLAALADPTLKCAVALSPFLAPTVADACRGARELTDTVPTLFLVGQWDTVAPACCHAWRHYHLTRSPKLILEVQRGGHAAANGPASGHLFETDLQVGGPCIVCKFFGMLCCPCCASRFEFTGVVGHARPDAKRGDVGGYALAWLKVFLEGDEQWRGLLEQRPKIASGFACEMIDRV